MADILLEKRKHVLWLQWLLLVALSYLLIFNRPSEGLSFYDAIIRPSEGFSLYDSVILGFLFLNVLLSLVPRRLFQTSAIDFVLVFFDIVFVALAIYLTGQATSDFYLFFFLILMMAAAGQNLRALMLGILTMSGLYAFLVFKTGAFAFTSAFLLRIPFLFIVGLFFGYLVYLQKIGEQRLRAESEFTVDLFEFGKALVQTEDIESLYSKIPKLIPPIMVTDSCELAIVEEGRITRRIFENNPAAETFPILEIDKSIHEKTYGSDEIQLTTDLLKDSVAGEKEDCKNYPYRSYMAKSWNPESGPSGLIAVYRDQEKAWSSHDRKKFQFLADQSLLALQYVFLLKELEAQARTDGLTGLANYRYFSERMEEEFARARRSDSILSVVLMDVDRFKQINDNFGHAVGDEILQHLSAVLKLTTRHMDVPARRGGDEFVILLPDTDEDEVKKLCGRLLEQIQAIEVRDLPSFSISVGCSTFPQNGSNISDILEHADRALYFSKGHGRACAWHYSQLAEAG